MDIVEKEMTRYERTKQHLGKIKKYGEIAKEELKLWGKIEWFSVGTGATIAVGGIVAFQEMHSPFEVYLGSTVFGIVISLYLEAIITDPPSSYSGGGCGGMDRF